MIALLCFFLTLFASPFKSKSRLEAENAALRHQLIVPQRRVSGRVQLTNGDRLFLVMLYRWFPSILKAITIIRPEKHHVTGAPRRTATSLHASLSFMGWPAPSQRDR
jgi:hypothetical protein